jgi:hypothetical protein
MIKNNAPTIGICFYPGLNYSMEENKKALDIASGCGVRDAFTSLHIPESNFSKLFNDCEELCRYAKEKGISVIADVSPLAFERIGARYDDLTPFYELGLSGLREDFGFEIPESVALINNPFGLKTVVNASSVSIERLEQLTRAGADVSRIEACHNFYPRKYTGLDLDWVIKKSAILQGFGIRVGAYVASQKNKRQITYEGLPTVEVQRGFSPARAAHELFLSECIDFVYIGDPINSNEELEELIKVSGAQEVLLRTKPEQDLLPEEKAILFGKAHYQSLDSGYSHVIRSSASREFGIVQPNHHGYRETGTITIDNAGYGRYCGELQICLKPMPPDPRVNTVGSVIEQDVSLLRYIDTIGKFRFIETYI